MTTIHSAKTRERGRKSECVYVEKKSGENSINDWEHYQLVYGSNILVGGLLNERWTVDIEHSNTKPTTLKCYRLMEK